MSDLDRYDANTALLWGLICVLIVALGWLIVAFVRYCKSGPRRMATRNTLPAPTKEATRYTKPGSL